MIDTIFSPSFGNKPTELVGREAILNELISCLQSQIGGKERTVLLLGNRGGCYTRLCTTI